MAGRKTAMTDPDLGAQSYTYDQDGNLVQSVDARGAAGTVFVGYDGLDRPIWRNATNSPSGAYDTYTYDTGGGRGCGRVIRNMHSCSLGHAYHIIGVNAELVRTKRLTTKADSSTPSDLSQVFD